MPTPGFISIEVLGAKVNTAGENISESKDLLKEADK